MANERQHADYQRYLRFRKDDLFQVPSDKKYVFFSFIALFVLNLYD
jgi:hypothetical protein